MKLLRTQTASELGCVMDCNLATGLNLSGGPATDNTAILNAFLATASASNPIRLIIDGGTLISGLQISATGYTTIEGLGWKTGFFVKSGANADAINNFPTKNTLPFSPGPPAPSQTGGDVIIRDLFINGNRGNGTTGNSTTGDPRGTSGVTWYTGISLANISHLLIDYVWCYDTAAYNVLLSNISDVRIENCRFESPSLVPNTDSIHFNGSCSEIKISDCYFLTGDDGVALNCPEGYGGNISKVLIDNCYFPQAASIVRVYGSAIGSTNTIDSVVIVNCIANISGMPIFIGFSSSPTNLGGVGSVKVENCIITANVLAQVSNNISLLELSNITLVLGGSPSGVQVISPATIAELKVNGLSGQGSALAYLVDVPVGTAITKLWIDAIDPSCLAALVSSNGFTRITGIGGSGLKAMAFEIPNANMLNGSDFLSATSHLPSVKIAGTVKTYTVT